MRTIFALALAACGTGAPAPAVEPAPSNQAVATHATPAPEVHWDAAANKFVASLLPAVAHGRELVVVPVHDSDGGRGNPNLRLEVRDRTDKVTQTIAIARADEYDHLVVNGNKASPELERRLDAANRELAKLHGLHDLQAMHGLEVQKPAGDALQHFAIGDGLDVDFAGDHLHVFHHNANNAFVTLDTHGWLAKPRPMPDDPSRTAMCKNPAFLAGVYHANEINVLVVEIAYMGTDTCWEPTEQFHVIAW